MSPTDSGTPAADILRLDRELQQHLASLGLATLAEYEAWCERHGFGVRLKKNWKQRCRERYIAGRERIHNAAAECRQAKRRPRETLERVLDGDLGAWEAGQPRWHLVDSLASSVRGESTFAAFRQLLLHVEASTGLISIQPPLNQFGENGGSTYIHALLSLARQTSNWIRPLETWKPKTHNVRRQFASLAFHLLANYSVPAYFDSAWFVSDSEQAVKQQGWYCSIGNGVSPRKLDLPLRLTRRMAHHFLRAPSNYSIDAALRYGQVMGLGGSPRLVAAVLSSRIGTSFENNDFWVTVIRWLIAHPAVENRHIGPLIDYVHFRRFGDDVESTDADGPTQSPTATAVFEIRGRTASALLRQMHEWHGDLRKSPDAPHLEWLPSGIMPLDWTESVDAEGKQRRWTTVELLSRKALFDEGMAMRHCVASYVSFCVGGGTSIWSLGVEVDGGSRKRRLTIELSVNSRVVCQVRGKANRLPNEREMTLVRRWAAEAGLTLPGY